jgi:hypothetical protein
VLSQYQHHRRFNTSLPDVYRQTDSWVRVPVESTARVISRLSSEDRVTRLSCCERTDAGVGVGFRKIFCQASACGSLLPKPPASRCIASMSGQQAAHNATHGSAPGCRKEQLILSHFTWPSFGTTRVLDVKVASVKRRRSFASFEHLGVAIAATPRFSTNLRRSGEEGWLMAVVRPNCRMPGNC